MTTGNLNNAMTEAWRWACDKKIHAYYTDIIVKRQLAPESEANRIAGMAVHTLRTFCNTGSVNPSDETLAYDLAARSVIVFNDVIPKSDFNTNFLFGMASASLLYDRQASGYVPGKLLPIEMQWYGYGVVHAIESCCVHKRQDGLKTIVLWLETLLDNYGSESLDTRFDLCRLLYMCDILRSQLSVSQRLKELDEHCFDLTDSPKYVELAYYKEFAIEKWNEFKARAHISRCDKLQMTIEAELRVLIDNVNSRLAYKQ